MKKLLAIIVLGLLWSGNANANAMVLFCSDNLVTGMGGDYTSITKYTAERFKAKIDTQNRQLIIEGNTYKSLGEGGLGLFANEYGSTIHIFKEGSTWAYHRSSVFGMSDAVFVATGSCEKF